MSRKKSFLVKALFLLGFIIVWEIVAKRKLFGSNSQIVFPTVEAIAKAFVRNFKVGYAGISLWTYILNSMELLLIGLFLGTFLAFVFSAFSMINPTFYEIYNMMVSVCDLLPGVAVLPVVIIIFGIHSSVIIFLVIHSVIWPMSRNLLDGFHSFPQIYIEAGKNIGLRGKSLLTGIYLPATTAYILSGLKVGWARAWRGLLSAEMIFGIASSPGIGLFINQMRTNLNNAEVYATLVVIIFIGVVVQYGIIDTIEKHTIKKWGISK